MALIFFALTFLVAAGMAVGYDRHLAYDFFLRTALWILPTFACVTLLIGMLRDRDGIRLSALNLPMILTLLRVVLAPGLALLLIRRHFGAALVVFLIAAFTDVADGWVARRSKQITRLGTVLDAQVDIVFNLALFAGLAAARLVAPWVLWVAALRYTILVVGGACLYVFVGPVRIYPTFFGRLTGVIMAALVALLVFLRSHDGTLAERLAPLTRIALGVLLSATVAQVIALGWYNLRVMRGQARAQGRVVGDVRWRAS